MYLKNYSNRNNVPQTEPIPGREEDQAQNHAGGFSFKISLWDRLERFLILGTEGGSYYVGEREMTKENITVVKDALKEDGARALGMIIQISEDGRAPKNDPALFALAMVIANGTPSIKAEALKAIPRVARTGTHFLHLVTFLKGMRGFGRSVSRALGRWYLDKGVDKATYQMLKYQSRDGMSHRDVLRLVHPVTKDPQYQALFRYFTSKDREPRTLIDPKRPTVIRTYGGIPQTDIPALVNVYEQVKTLNPENQNDRRCLCSLIGEYRLTHEMVPNDFKGHPEIWEALLQDMPAEATLRNLGVMTANGVLSPFSGGTKMVLSRLSSEGALLKARLHPLKILVAKRVYQAGHGMKGSLSWTPVPQILDVLEEAFYGSFGVITPTNKNTYLGIDCSGSMWGGAVCGSSLTPAAAAACMAMVTLRTEQAMTYGFNDTMRHINITAKSSLAEVERTMKRVDWGGTDCALPMLHALKNKWPVESFIIYTDSETWMGSVHPAKALQRYRQEMGIPAKLVVVGMTATEFSIADPNDAGMLDVVGFDTATPNVMNDFLRK